MANKQIKVEQFDGQIKKKGSVNFLVLEKVQEILLLSSLPSRGGSQIDTL